MANLPPPPVRLQLYVGPAIPIPAPKAVLDALDQVTVISESGASQSGFELTFKVPKKFAAGDALPAHRRNQHPDPPRRDRSDRRWQHIGADGRRDDAPRDQHRRSDAGLEGQGQGPVGDHGRHPARRGALSRNAAGRACADRAREVRRARLRPARYPEPVRGRADPDRPDPPSSGHRLRLRQDALPPTSDTCSTSIRARSRASARRTGVRRFASASRNRRSTPASTTRTTTSMSTH